jgi:hypothetical protein
MGNRSGSTGRSLGTVMARPWSALAGCLLAAACAGCSTFERSLVFFTDTTVGLNISPGNGTTAPKALLAYHRTEGVLNPVYDSKGIEGTFTDNGTATTATGVKKYRDDAYSVLAKYEGSSSGGDASNSNAQWFATGRAAELLAESPLSMAAVAGLARVETVTNASSPAPAAIADHASLLVQVYAALESAPTDDSRAKDLLQALDALDSAALTPSIDRFIRTTTPPAYSKDIPRLPSRHGFTRLLAFWSRAANSEETLSAMAKETVDPVALHSAPTPSISQSDIAAQLATTSAQRQAVESVLRANNALLLQAATYAIQLRNRIP